jgi:ribosomal-protein-alanine N-acetyltransferase
MDAKCKPDGASQVLETRRLVLRKFTPSDAGALFRIYCEPDVLKYFSRGAPDSIEAERAAIERHLSYYECHGFGLWATILKESGELIGRCGLLAQELDGIADIEIGYLLSPRFWGRGLASESARGIRDFGFHVLGCERLISIIHTENEASKRVAAAIGMTPSRRTRFHDVEVEIFSIIRACSPPGRHAPFG